MSFDGLFTHSMANELNQKLSSGRVMRISQPFPNEIIITVRANRKNYPLLLSAHPMYARVQITKIPYTNPPVPTKFTMMLRKYLEGARLISIKQPENDRILNFYFSNRNELGDQMPLILSSEIMGRHSNLILINQQSNKIIDTIKHVGMDQNRYRTLLPGSTYRTPPKQDKQNPLTTKAEDINALVRQYPNREIFAQQLVKRFQGIAADSALYIADYLHMHSVDTDTLKNLWQQLDTPTPTLVDQPQLSFSCFAYSQLENNSQQTFSSLSELLDTFYRHKATRDRVQQQGTKLIHTVKVNLNKNRKKLAKLTKELQTTNKADIYRVKGEILTTFLYKIQRGMQEITLPNYYDNDKPLKITLSNQLSPSQNAQKYFKRYTKLRNAVKFINEQMALTKTEINYLENIQSQLELATPKDLPDIDLELRQEGYLKKQKGKNTKRKQKLSQPELFYASDGTKIFVGKNNLQNDYLSLKKAAKKDWWLHVKDFPGSHVIINTEHPSEQTLIEAASLAAYFSKERSSSNVLVDYVQVKKLRKPNGAKPGFVIYEGQQTISVTPSVNLIDSLKKDTTTI